MLMNMIDLLAVAHANNFAVPAFNVSSNMLLKGAIEASEEKRAPVIVAIHPDELSFIRPCFVKTVIEEAINLLEITLRDVVWKFFPIKSGDFL